MSKQLRIAPLLARFGSGQPNSHTFAPAANYAAGLYPFTVTAGDFLSNGTLQLAVTDLNGGNISLLQNSRKGWSVFSTFPTSGRPVGIITGDFNHDGKLGLAIGGDGPRGVSLMFQK